jgi:hypothetical protein
LGSLFWGKIAFIFAVLLGVTLLLKLNGGSFKAVFLLYSGAETAKGQPVATPSRSFDLATEMIFNFGGGKTRRSKSVSYLYGVP